MKLHTTRLVAGDDLRKTIADFVIEKRLSSGVLLSAVGSLREASVRMAGAEPSKQAIRHYDGPLEIVSLLGTVTGSGAMHLHLSFADAAGTVCGGHLKAGCIVHTTVELVILEDENHTYHRKLDTSTGFDELLIE